ncbi:flavin-containing monooxygenase [Spirosoma sp.]|uniref:flavin-containing monooxygenase n=1 Tax=Spirosoma sp. TaxID=1899569 RepID=UPI003B3A1110
MQLHTCATLIIGAGPAGLAMAGQLAHRKLPFTVLEASEHIGFSWRNHYDRLHLHTVKEHSALPHFPFPTSYPTYVSRLQFVEYLERYAEHFGINPVFSQKVTHITRNPQDGTWRVQTQTDTFRAEQVIVATGYNREPNVPELPGQRNYRGIVWHSYEYRNGAPFRDENVLVVGMGNTAAELALDLLENQAKPFISVRSPVNIIRRDLFGRPAQKTAILMQKFPAWFTNIMARLMQRISIGDLSAYGLGKPAHSPTQDLRRGKPPVIDVGTLAQIKAGKITILPGIERINGDSGPTKIVTFTDGRELPFDAIILATGYRPGLATVIGDELAGKILNERGYPKKLWFDDRSLRGLYFLGFSIPITGVLYHLNIDSEKIAKHISENNFVSA